MRYCWTSNRDGSNASVQWMVSRKVNLHNTSQCFKLIGHLKKPMVNLLESNKSFLVWTVMLQYFSFFFFPVLFIPPSFLPFSVSFSFLHFTCMFSLGKAEDKQNENLLPLRKEILINCERTGQRTCRLRWAWKRENTYD